MTRTSIINSQAGGYEICGRPLVSGPHLIQRLGQPATKGQTFYIHVVTGNCEMHELNFFNYKMIVKNFLTTEG